MKKYKKILSLLLCFMLLLSLIPAMAFAEEIEAAEETVTEEVSFTEAEAADEGDSTGTDTDAAVAEETDAAEADSTDTDSTDTGSTDTDTEESADIPVYGTEADIVSAIRDAMTAHADTMSFDITKELGAPFRPEGEMTDDAVEAWRESLAEWAGTLADQAMAHTGEPIQGDTLRWTIQEVRPIAAPQTSMYEIWRFTVSFTWYTTADEETALTAKVDEIMSELNLASVDSDYDCVAAIYYYLTNTAGIEYEAVDYDADDPAYTNANAYGALVNGKADSMGIALAFYRLALEADIDNRVVQGTDADGNEIVCNIVKLGSCYYFVNAAADLNMAEESYTAFLCGTRNFDFDPLDGAMLNSYPVSAYDYSGVSGDANGDGVADSADLAILKAYLAQTEGAEVPSDAADMNQDGSISLVDLLMLKNQLAND